VTLFRRAFPSVAVIEDGKWKSMTFDYHTPMGNLPRYLRPSRKSFPFDAKYLVPDSAHATQWSNRLDALGDGPKVGICWRSGLRSEERDRFYTRLEAWEPVFRIGGIHWINLQYDHCEAELTTAEAAFDVEIRRWPKEDLKNDLESVVGLLWNLDWVITAPTAVSALAGAAGRPTIELDNGGDWTAHGEDTSPWFPTVRHLRRPYGSADWGPVIHQLAIRMRQVAGPRSVAV
jgi:hypothetical protein